MRKQYEMFLKHIKDGGKILDFGCGSGRDSLYFHNLGYEVYPIDGSIEMCKLAHQYTSLPVKCINFNELSDIDFYDGIWACSTILHVPRKELLSVLIKLRDSLKQDGYMYTSFTDGYDKEENKEDGRYFNDLSKDKFISLSSDAGFEIIDQSTNKSLVLSHKDVYWSSYILKRK
jgi:SAM-dependent methyltransferase